MYTVYIRQPANNRCWYIISSNGYWECKHTLLLQVDATTMWEATPQLHDATERKGSLLLQLHLMVPRLPDADAQQSQYAAPTLLVTETTKPAR